jgi:hypothetical protein
VLLLVDVVLRVVLGPTFQITEDGVLRPGFLMRPRLIPYADIQRLRLTRRGGSVDRLWIVRRGGRLRNLQWLPFSITRASSPRPLDDFARVIEGRTGVPLTDERPA